ncbi:ComEA family DNA-binding protein [Herbidospora cretacea]|uniref:ComEA family DNA-binding protein n=1 Tax=Herbidospora cretacea TaxID=28444 RepID=UPI000691C72D|nr:ComEA family DNA-binding protein [Herbidospora cretacea]
MPKWPLLDEDELADDLDGPLDPGRRGIKGLIVVGVVAALVAVAIAIWTRPREEPLTPPTPVAGSSVAPSPVQTAAAAEVTVYVTGKVKRPGVIALPLGSRVVDAIMAAGGLKRGAEPGGLNLARRVIDGEQIAVGEPGAAALPPGVTESGVVSLNSATVEQLDQLPGVGEVLAQRIVEYRDTNGGFQSIEQLREVEGIGDAKFADLKDQVTL